MIPYQAIVQGLTSIQKAGGYALWGPKTPVVPDFIPTDLTAAQGKAVSANIANLPALQKLGGAVNVWTQDQLAKMIEGSLGAGTAGQIKSNIADLVAGKLPESQLQRGQLQGAARALGMGVAGSEFGAGMALAGIRQDQVKNMEAGFSQALQWLNATRAPQFNLAGGLIETGQAVNIAAKEAEDIWNVQWLKNQIAAMPSRSDVAWSMANEGLANSANSMFGGGEGGGFASMIGGGGGGSGGLGG